MEIQGTCSACLKTVEPVRPSRLWWALAIVAAPIVLISFMLLAIMQPIGMIAAPLYFMFLTFPIVGLAEKLGAKPKCPKCRKIFVDVRRSAPFVPFTVTVTVPAAPARRRNLRTTRDAKGSSNAHAA